MGSSSSVHKKSASKCQNSSQTVGACASCACEILACAHGSDNVWDIIHLGSSERYKRAGACK
eukprot:3565197-Pleurochrysis_carterae.AAC.2